MKSLPLSDAIGIEQSSSGVCSEPIQHALFDSQQLDIRFARQDPEGRGVAIAEREGDTVPVRRSLVRCDSERRGKLPLCNPDVELVRGWRQVAIRRRFALKQPCPLVVLDRLPIAEVKRDRFFGISKKLGAD